MIPISRREFLSASAATLVAVSTRGFGAEVPGQAKPWYASMLRCGHLNLNERDPLNLDAEAWTDYFASLKVDTVLHNGGGIMAFYPTEIPFQHRSRFLGVRDLLGELVTASRKRGIRVVSRMDPNYMAPCYHWLGGHPEDTRWRETGRAFFDWLAANEQHFRNRRSMANLAVLYPQSTISFYGAAGDPARKLNGATIDPADFLDGLYEALLKGRFIFDFIHQENLSAESLKQYSALLIPNAAYLRDSECDAIRAFAASGGSVLATFETSRYNEWGDARPDLGLKELFGVSANGPVIGPAGNSYMRIEQPHPILEGYEGTAILPGPEFRLPVSRSGSGPLHLSVVPAYPAFPPEMVFTETPRTDQPAAMFLENGASRVVYFPGDVDRTYSRSGHLDFSRLLVNSVHWLQNRRQGPVSIKGAGMFELFAWETEPGFALHILNYTNPRMRGPYTSAFYPAGPLEVQFEVPAGHAIASVRACRANRNLAFQQSQGRVSFEVPSVVDYEVVALT